MAKQVLIKSKLFGNVGKRIADKNSNSTVKKGESLRNMWSTTESSGKLYGRRRFVIEIYGRRRLLRRKVDE